jgi:hypothetical protein
MAYPEMITAIAHLRDVLGNQTYESLARKGETMTTDEMATYAYAQISACCSTSNPTGPTPTSIGTSSGCSDALTG